MTNPKNSDQKNFSPLRFISPGGPILGYNLQGFSLRTEGSGANPEGALHENDRPKMAMNDFTLDSGGVRMVEEIPRLRRIGVVHSPYREKGEAPFQGRHRNEESMLEVYEAYEPALLDSEQCSHLLVLYWQDRGDRSILQSRTPWGPEVHGVFATRSPNRPNPIGLCVVELLERHGRFLRVRGMDALDGSPLIDIKVYSAQIDSVPNSKIGWREDKDLPSKE